MSCRFSGMKVVGDFTESCFGVEMGAKVRLGREWEVGKWRHKVETIFFFLSCLAVKKRTIELTRG